MIHPIFADILRAHGAPEPLPREWRGQKIETVHTYPPIPIRDFDWHAYLDPEGTYGEGPTEAAAIADLIRELGELT